MDEVAMLNQMARFDFNKPFAVTITFEDDEHLCKDEINIVDIHSQDCLNIEENNEMKNIEYNTTLLNEELHNDINVAVTEQTQLNTEINLNTNNDTHTQMQTIRDVNSTEKDLVRRDNVESVNNPNSVVNTNNTYELTSKNSITDSEIYHHLTDGDELSKHLQKQLDEISDHLVRIMIPYYQFSDENHRRNNLKSREWDDMKISYFDLSYNIVVTLMLPREKNNIFVNKFLDRTITCARNLYNWKFEPHHVKPFYNELIDWSKRKREKENTQVLQNGSKNLRTQNKINNRKNPKMLKGNKGNKKKIKKKRINNDNLADICINDIRNGIKDISLIEQRINNNSMNKIIQRVRNNEINGNNVCDSRISDQRKEINDSNSINTQLIDNGINLNGIHGTKDISNRKYVSVIVDNTVNNCNSIDNKIKNTKTGLNEDNLINENQTLAARLVGPPQPLNFSHSTVAPIPSLNLNSNNSTCIFSAGDPGEEISINVSSDVLLAHAKKHQEIQKIQNLVDRIQSKENCVLDPSNSQIVPKQVPCRNGLGQIRPVPRRPDNITCAPKPLRPPRPPRPPPPPYSSSAHNILTPAPQTYNCNIGQAPNHSQMTRIQTQRNINTHSTPEHNNWNLTQMYNTQIEQQATTTCVATTYTTTSQNQNATTRRITGLCNFCGNPTYKICSKCKKISYCNKICQSLHKDYVARFLISNK